MVSSPKSLGKTSHEAPAADAGGSQVSEWEQRLHGPAHEGSEALEMKTITSPLGYLATPQVSQLSPNQIMQKLSDYKNSLRLYYGKKEIKPPPFPSEGQMVDRDGNAKKITQWHHDTWKTWPEDAKRWLNRGSDALFVAGHIEPSSNTEPSNSIPSGQEPSERLFVISLGEAPAAFVQTDHRTNTHTGMSPTAHLGVSEAGIPLVEVAVNDSQDRGLQGKIKVDPVDGAKEYYKNIGFDPKTWELDPKTSDLWRRIDGRWSYVPFNEKGYLAAQTGEGNILGYDPVANAAAAAALERPSSSHSSSSTSSESSEE